MKRLILLTITTLLYLCAKAQYAQQWGLEFPWNTSLNIVSAVAFNDNYAIAGSFSDTLVLGNDTLYSNGMEDVFLLTMDSEGEITNFFSFGDIGNDIPTDIVCADGKLFLLGNSITGRNCSVFIHSLDMESLQTHHMSFPYEGILSVDFIKIYEETIIIGGSLKGVLTVGSHSVVSEKKERAFVAALSDDGEMRFGWVATGNCPNRAKSLIIDEDGSCALLLNTGTGRLVLSDTTSIIMETGGSVIVYFDSKKNPTWIQKITGNDFIEATSMTSDTTGYSIAVNFKGKVSIKEDSFYSNGLSSLLVHYGREGLVEWIEEISSDEHCRIMNIDALGDLIFCTGYYFKNLIVSGDTVCWSEEKSSFLMSFDSYGRLIWLADVDRLNPNDGNRVVCDTNSVLLNGSVTGRESVAYTDKYIIKDRKSPFFDTSAFEGFDSVAEGSVVKERQEGASLSFVFPNPVQSNLYWTTNQEKDWCLQVLDEKGVILQKCMVKKTSSGHIDVSHLSPGLYFLSIMSPEKTFCHCFTKY